MGLGVAAAMIGCQALHKRRALLGLRKKKEGKAAAAQSEDSSLPVGHLRDAIRVRVFARRANDLLRVGFDAAFVV